jgi:hypothetical protein
MQPLLPALATIWDQSDIQITAVAPSPALVPMSGEMFTLATRSFLASAFILFVLKINYRIQQR